MNSKNKYSVTVEGVHKKFGLSLKSALKYGLIDSGRRLVGMGKSDELRSGEFWALQNINFNLEPGDALGIMGVNGSGKTTLLRILNGTYSPDRGKVTMRGKIGALIAAGAGFSPMLSGRENVFISGSLLGMSGAEIRKKFDEIVHFAELEKFIDMPVRNYSSGMSVRLGFAVAVLGQPEILLVDEVLAVGDLSFQKKCYERLGYLKSQGVTILLVSHSIGAMWSVCTKGIFLHKGEHIYTGEVAEACRLYDEYNAASAMQGTWNSSSSRGGTGDVVYTNAEIISESGEKLEHVVSGEPCTFAFDIDVKNHLSNPTFRFSMDSPHYKMFYQMDTHEQGYEIEHMSPGRYRLTYTIDKLMLRPGAYSLNASIVCKEHGIHSFFQMNILSFKVIHPRDMFFHASDRAVMFNNALITVGEIVNKNADM